MHSKKKSTHFEENIYIADLNLTDLKTLAVFILKTTLKHMSTLKIVKVIFSINTRDSFKLLELYKCFIKLRGRLIRFFYCNFFIKINAPLMHTKTILNHALGSYLLPDIFRNVLYSDQYFTSARELAKMRQVF